MEGEQAGRIPQSNAVFEATATAELENARQAKPQERRLLREKEAKIQGRNGSQGVHAGAGSAEDGRSRGRRVQKAK